MRSPDSASIQIHACEIGRTTVMLLVLCATPPPPSFCSCPNPPSLFIKTCLFLFYSFPSSQILPVKNTGEKMRGRNGGEQNLSEEKGPLSEAPFPPKNAPRDGERWKKWKKKNCSLYFLKIDFSLTPRGGLTGRQVGVWIEGGRAVKEEGSLFQTQKQMKEVFWQNRQCDGDAHHKQGARCLANTNPC